MSINNINDYIKFKVIEYGHYNFTNDDMWEQYQEDFADFMETIFKTCNHIATYNLQTLLHDQGVWVEKDKWVIIAWSLYNTLCEEDPTEWTKEQILDQV